MRLVHHFPHSNQPDGWPEDYKTRIELVEDGDDTSLYVDYDDKKFIRPMAPFSPNDLREEYGGEKK